MTTAHYTVTTEEELTQLLDMNLVLKEDDSITLRTLENMDEAFFDVLAKLGKSQDSRAYKVMEPRVHSVGNIHRASFVQDQLGFVVTVVGSEDEFRARVYADDDLATAIYR